MTTSTVPAPAPAFPDRFHARAGAGATLTFAEFMALALYDPEVGYYRGGRPRVGRGADTDFFTATTVGPVFGEAVVAACVTLLGGAAVAARHEFVELGAEDEAGVLAGISHPFARARVVRVGVPVELTGPCVVFSNELFDAQPLRRFVRRGREWRELGVRLAGAALAELELEAVAAPWLPEVAPEGYLFDAPRDAMALAGAIAAQPWHGLFVACDYGKSWEVLATATPAGTVRAYHWHTQTNDLLARPGEQDLTGHVCWDWLQAALVGGGFAAPVVESQEAFFVRNAAGWLEAALAGDTHPLSPRKRALMQLLHPAQMGQKFQVLHARRKASAV
jgi:SAM-dependent MidA family methyltransferase